MEKTFKVNAVYAMDGNCYNHFGIHPSLASMYGVKVKDIVELQMRVSADQITPDEISTKADYWGWYDNEDQRFSMIYPKRFLLEMCFPYGIKACEDQNQGKAYRLEIVK